MPAKPSRRRAGKATERDRQREQTRQKVYEAALTIIRRDGAGPARIEDIVELAGVSRGTFYFHFPSKDDVLIQLLQESQLEMVSVLEAMPADAPIRSLMEAVASAIARRWVEEPQMLSEVGVAALKYTAQRITEIGKVHPLHEALVPRFQQAMDRGELLAGLPAEIGAELFLVSLFSAALAWCGNPLLPLEQMLSQVVFFYLRAAAPDDRRPEAP
jgi:AcrR family transcriptional regulator